MHSITRLSPGVYRLAGRLAGREAVFLVDSGASSEFIDSGFALRARLKLTASRRAIKLADGTLVSAMGLAEVDCALAAASGGTFDFRSQFYATKLQGYDAILGMTWLARFNPDIDWSERCLRVRHNPKDQKAPWRILKPLAQEDVPARLAPLAMHSLEGLLGENELRRLLRDADTEEIFAMRIRAPAASGGVEVASTGPEQLAAVDSADPDLAKLMLEFADVLPAKLPPGVPPSRGIEHNIELKIGAKPPNAPPLRRYSPAEDKEMVRQVQEALEAGRIRPSQSPYGAMVLFVKKKDGTLRMCVDYRALNDVTVKNKLALPLADDLFDHVQGARFFSKLDLNAGFNQIPVVEADREKTAFRTRFGHFEYTVLPMGLCNAPATFMHLMNTVFKDELGRFVLVFLDDILIFSRTKEEHLAHLRAVLTRLREAKLYAKPSKCEWMQDQVEFLGHRIGRGGLTVMQEKVAAIQAWPTPKDASDVRSFLGLAGFYRKFVRGFSRVAQPLTELTHDKAPWTWGDSQRLAFEALQKALSEAPVLRIADPALPYTLHTDASGYAVGAALMQDHGSGLQPVAFFSKKMLPAEMNYAPHEQELLAVVKACKHWRHYLHSDQPFIVLADHKSLRFFSKQPQLSTRQVRWSEQLSEFDFSIQYIEGADNVVADALSRRSDHRSDRVGEEDDRPSGPAAVGPDGRVSREAFLRSWMSDDDDDKSNQPATLSAAIAQQRAPPAQTAADPADSAAETAARQSYRDAARQVVPPAAGQPAPNAKGAIVTPSQRCTATTHAGKHCKQRTAKGEYCWNHLRALDGLRVKKSGVPRAGMGLWAEKDFRAGDKVAAYTGDRIALSGDRDGGVYVLQTRGDSGIDAARTNAGAGRWANDPRGTDGNRANVEFAYDARRKTACLRATRPIRKGDEVLAKYGAAYWRAYGNQAREGVRAAITAKVMRKVGPRAADEQMAGATVAQLAGAIEAQAHFSLLDEARAAAAADSDYSSLLTKGGDGWAVRNGLAYHNERLRLPADLTLRTRAIMECHDTPTGGHLGRDKTLAAVQRRFEWPGLSSQVEHYVATCDVCQRSKHSQQLTPGQLMPLPVPAEIDSHWTMDFVTGLPKTKRGFDAIQGHFSRGGAIKRFAATHTTATAVDAARLFVDSVVRHHGVPASVVSDRDPKFVANFWQAFLHGMKTKLSMSAGYHPQTDGRSERDQRTLEQYLRAFCNDHADDWDELLPWAELALNSTQQASLGCSPYYLLYGREPAQSVDRALEADGARSSVGEGTTPDNPAAQNFHARIRSAWTSARSKALVAQERMAKNADRARRELVFEVGDAVLLLNKRLHFKETRSKLSALYSGPFKILEVINRNAYKLELPPRFDIHPVVNISFLKPYRDGTAAFPARPPLHDRPPPAVTDSNGQPEWTVERVVAQRGRGRGQRFLVYWKGYGLEEATWQSRADLAGAKELLQEFLDSQQPAAAAPPRT